MDLKGVRQPLAGRFGAAEGSVEQPDAVGMGAHEADQGAIDRARVGDREQIVEKPLAQQAVLQGDGGRGHLADEDRPQVGAIGVPVLQGKHGVEFPAGGVEVAGAGIEPGGDGVCVCGRAYPPANRLLRHVP